MNLSRGVNTATLTTFMVALCMSLFWGVRPAEAFQPQPEPPGVFMPTLTPEDGLRVNIAYLPKDDRQSARGLILIMSLIDGRVLKQEQFMLEPGKGMSMDVNYEELLRTSGFVNSQLTENGDLPLRIQVKAYPSKNVLVGFEIHDALITYTRTYFPGVVERLTQPLD